jgi:hypothetical protein
METLSYLALGLATLGLAIGIGSWFVGKRPIILAPHLIPLPEDVMEMPEDPNTAAKLDLPTAHTSAEFTAHLVRAGSLLAARHSHLAAPSMTQDDLADIIRTMLLEWELMRPVQI